MNIKEFNKVLDARIKKTRNILLAKGKEYSYPDDVLHNFKKVAAFRGITLEGALMGMVIKHIAALDDFVSRAHLDNSPTLEQWEEKLDDIICYMHLLDAVVLTRKGIKR